MIALLTLIACGVDEENFAERFAEVSCDQGIACEEPGFTDYADAEQCLPDALADWQAVEAMGEEFGCPLDYSLAADCLAIFKGADCAAVADRSWESEGACAELLACAL